MILLANSKMTLTLSLISRNRKQEKRIRQQYLLGLYPYITVK